jgi:hypothetical protein
MAALDADAASGGDSGTTRAVDAEELMKVIGKMTMFDRHLSPQQRDWFSGTVRRSASRHGTTPSTSGLD